MVAVAKLDLRPTEQVLFPNPYMEEEKNPLVVTTMRVLWSGDGKKQAIDADKITYTGKGNNPQIMTVVVMLFLLGLPFFIFGAYKYVKYRNLPMEVPAAVKGAPETAYTAAQKKAFDSNKNNFILGVVVGVFGAALGGGSYLLYKRRLMIMVGGPGKIMNIPVKDATEQDKLLTMVGAAQTSAKAMGASLGPQKVVKPPAAGK
jgi:hypothetical protein